MTNIRSTGENTAEAPAKEPAEHPPQPAISFGAPLRFLIGELQKTAEQFYQYPSEPAVTRKGVLLFTASALQVAMELLRVSSEVIAGWLLVRTLWHNTGCLALFLLDLRGHATIAQLLDYDSDERAERMFVDELTHILGGAEAARLWKEASVDPKELQALAKTARSNKPSEGGWESIRVKDLKKALRQMCDLWGTKNATTAAMLRMFVKHTDIARTRGDTLAHPNLFGVENLLKLVDIDAGRITIDPAHLPTEQGLREIVAIELLVLHAATIALRFPAAALDFARLLNELQAHNPSGLKGEAPLPSTDSATSE